MLLVSDLYPALFWKRDPVTVTNLAAITKVPVATIAATLGLLEDAGLASPFDRAGSVWRATGWASRSLPTFVRQAYAAGVRLGGVQLRPAAGVAGL